tara:strand:+ start:598 stop:1020 length:423 start_codon:yes stop_codon:yes gene_type:complete
MNNEISIFFTKLIHIFLASICIMFLGVFASKNLNAIYPDTKKEKELYDTRKERIKIFLIVCLFTGLIYISHYFIRNILGVLNKHVFSSILFWSDSINYDTNRLKELGGGIAMALALFLFMKKYKKDLKYLFNQHIDLAII